MNRILFVLLFAFFSGIANAEEPIDAKAESSLSVKHIDARIQFWGQILGKRLI